MPPAYANVPANLQDTESSAREEVQRRWPGPLKYWSSRAAIVACLALVAVVGLKRSAHGPLRGSHSEEVIRLNIVTKKGHSCSQLWGQCGGKDYDGPTCCEEGSECQDYALEHYKSYRQCRKPEPPKCGDPEPGSVCHNRIQAAKADCRQNPAIYHGLWPEADDKEFQMFLHWTIPDDSQCDAPCADGPCFFALHVEGCDTMESWYCEHNDGSLMWACCCKYFHEEKSLEKPKDPDADMAKAMEAAESSSPSFFCVAMVLPHGYELPLLRAQYERGKLGLFDCNEWALYSNQSLRISPKGHKPMLKTDIINGSLTADVGGDWGTALNTDVFIRFWDRVILDKKAWRNDWIVKVDPDTMWLPSRLRALLVTSHGPLGSPEPEKGAYINNCHVGLHGPIEVVSGNALKTYRAGRKECQHGEVSKIGQEDYFLRECFKKLGILQVDAYNLMLEATLACQEVASALHPDRPPCFSPQVAFHPFKTVHTWMRCHEEAANHPWALPVIPVTDEPSEANDRHG